jgi:hypothetical protein
VTISKLMARRRSRSASTKARSRSAALSLCIRLKCASSSASPPAVYSLSTEFLAAKPLALSVTSEPECLIVITMYLWA